MLSSNHQKSVKYFHFFISSKICPLSIRHTVVHINSPSKWSPNQYLKCCATFATYFNSQCEIILSRYLKEIILEFLSNMYTILEWNWLHCMARGTLALLQTEVNSSFLYNWIRIFSSIHRFFFHLYIK